MTDRQRICVAAVAGAHGVKGAVKLKSFTEDPAAVVRYGPLMDEAGETAFKVRLLGEAKGTLIAEIEGVRDRTAAEAMKGLRLYVLRSALPKVEDDDEFYHADLIGLAVEDRDGRTLGTVRAVQNYGAGDLIEVAGGEGPPLLLPFTRAVVPVVDLNGRRLVVDPPAEVEAGQEERA